MLSKMIGHKVKAYRNLNKPSYFSVKGKGADGKDKVQGYSQFLVLNDVTFIGGNSKAQKDIQSGGHRSVHAYAVGTLYEIHPFPMGQVNLIEVTYRPKERSGFFIVRSGEEVTSADVVFLMNSKMYCINPR